MVYMRYEEPWHVYGTLFQKKSVDLVKYNTIFPNPKSVEYMFGTEISSSFSFFAGLFLVVSSSLMAPVVV